MHLRPDELIDLAEGTRAESSATHLAECAVCRLHLAELKATMSAAADVNVPEPSPLFWDHFSARVHDAVAAEGSPRRSFWTWPRVVIPAVSMATAVLAVAITLNWGSADRGIAPPPAVGPAPVALPVASAELLADPQSAGDTALTLVAELSSDMDLETAREAGLAARGSAEHAVTHLTGSELRELQRLLQEELARSGA
jgi:hypothetical protein